MRKRKIVFSSTLITLLMLNLFLIQTVAGKTGFGPAEIFTSNQRDALVIGKATLINGDDVAKYGVFSMIRPYSHRETWQVVPSEIVHARVVCDSCGNEMQRYEAIEGYVYGDPLHGVCTECGSADLIFYKPLPRDEYNCLSIEGAQNFHLEKINDNTYRTIEHISPGGACSVNLLYDVSESYLIENYKMHWEVHLRGSTQEHKEYSDFMAGGIDLRILISFKFPLFLDITSNIKKGEPFTVKVTYGDKEQTWKKIPEFTKVTFNGMTKPINQDGTVSFVFPDTRGDYEYKIEAKSNHYYLPITKMLKTGEYISNEESSILSIFTNIYVIIGIVCIVVIIIAVAIIRRDGRYPSKK